MKAIPKRYLQVVRPYCFAIFSLISVSAWACIFHLCLSLDHKHKAGRAAPGLSCDASFELPNFVYFGSGALY